MGVFDKIKEEQEPDDSLAEKYKDKYEDSGGQEGMLWVNMLIRFNTSGNAEIVTSFTKPASDSTIKKYSKKKKKKKTPKLKDKVSDEESLF